MKQNSLNGGLSRPAPLVSIVVPIYNHSKFVEEALRSVIGQNYRPIELIVIDDGSSDDSAHRAERLLRREMPEAVFVRRENKGAHNTINEGIMLAHGKYVTVLNSDDYYLPDRIARCVETAERTGRCFLFTGVNFIDEAGNPAPDDDYIRELKAAEKGASAYPTLGFALMKNQLAITTGNFFISRDLFNKLRGFRHYKYVHDWDFILRSIFYTEPYFIKAPLYGYRLHGSNTFKSLSSIVGYETSEVMRNFLWQMTRKVPENPRAPCEYFWPVMFKNFIYSMQYGVYMMPEWQNV